MDKQSIINLYNQGETHANITKYYFTHKKLRDNEYTYNLAEAEVIRTLLYYKRCKK